MLKVYHVPGTRSVRPIWLCYELDLPVEVAPVDFSPAFRNSPAWRAISPAGKVPVLTDGDLTMFESGAMVDYILERYGAGRLRPAPGTAEAALHHQWCWFSEATLLRPLGLNRLVRGKDEAQGAILADADRKARECLRMVDEALGGRDYLLGSAFGAADIMMGYALALIDSLGLLDEGYEDASRYLGRLRTRPAYARAASA